MCFVFLWCPNVNFRVNLDSPLCEDCLQINCQMCSGNIYYIYGAVGDDFVYSFVEKEEKKAAE